LKPPSRGSRHITWQTKILRTYVITFCFQANICSLTSGALAPFLQEWTTLHQQESRWKLAPGSLTSGGDHLCIDGSSTTATTSAPAATTTSAPSDSPAVATALTHAPLRKGPRPRLPTGGGNEAIKAKESGAQWQVALTVSPAEATTSAVGSLSSGGDHLSTDDSGHLRTSAVPANGVHPSPREEVLAPVLTARVRTRPSKNAAAAPSAYDVLYVPPVRPVAREKPWMWPTCARRNRNPCSGWAATLRPSGRRQRRRRHQSHPGRRARHAAADGASDGRPRVPGVCLLRKAGERPSPPNVGGRSGPAAHAEGRTPTRLTPLPSTDDEHP
jgi:hypothetical protein